MRRLGAALRTREERPSTSDAAEKPRLRRNAAPKTPTLPCLTVQVDVDYDDGDKEQHVALRDELFRLKVLLRFVEGFLLLKVLPSPKPRSASRSITSCNSNSSVSPSGVPWGGGTSTRSTRHETQGDPVGT